MHRNDNPPTKENLAVDIEVDSYTLYIVERFSKGKSEVCSLH